jgi:hypothetical protein
MSALSNIKAILGDCTTEDTQKAFNVSPLHTHIQLREVVREELGT